MPDPEEKDAAPNPAPGTEKATPKEEQKPELFAIQVDGQQRQVSLDELKKMAELSGGAQEKFRKAAAATKEAESALRLQELIKEGQDGSLTTAQWEEFSKLLGVDMEDLFPQEPASAPAEGETPAPAPVSPKKVEMKDLPKEITDKLRVLDKIQNNQRKDQILNEIGTAISNDKYLSKVVGKDAGIRDTVHDLVIREVQDAMLAKGRDYGPELVSEAMQYARAVVDNLSKLAQKTGQPVGLGPSEGILTSQQFDSGKVPERVPVTDPNYLDVEAQRVLQKARG